MVTRFYIDASPLENYHISEAFKVLLKPQNYIFEGLDAAGYRLVRRRMIECVLATDMVNHGKYSTSLKNKASVYGITNGENIEKMIIDKDNLSKTFENQQLVLCNLLHLADISNPAKPCKTYSKWIDLLFEEFFYQGDCEKRESLPISILCDRETTNINKAQVGFMKFVVRPLFELMSNLFPEISPYINTVDRNLQIYENKANDEEKKK